jgi:hypothetical protein
LPLSPQFDLLRLRQRHGVPFDYVPGFPDADVVAFFDDSVEHDGLRYAALPWLRRMKVAAGSPEDQLDVANLPE